MMNFNLYDFKFAEWAIRQLRADLARHLEAEEQKSLSDLERNQLIGALNFAHRQCIKLGLQSAEHRFERIFTDLRTMPEHLNHAWAVINLDVLIEAVDDDSKFERFYHYPQEKGRMFLRVLDDWKASIDVFPSAKKEIESGIDCYALEHNAASVFHMMRATEIGLRSLARERKVTFPRHPLEWAEWNDIIDEIEKSARAATNGMRRGFALDAARTFYSAAVAQLRAFKETRNKISHMRGEFDELDARRTINQVRDFMNGLASKISEKTRRPISKWP
jgi:hypothetical protein